MSNVVRLIVVLEHAQIFLFEISYCVQIYIPDCHGTELCPPQIVSKLFCCTEILDQQRMGESILHCLIAKVLGQKGKK